jgi:MFS family permease
LPASYPTILASIFFLAAGEAVWSPRLYEYTASIAPKGREASYMGLSSFPYFLAKMMAGPMGGYLLSAYCPEHGPRHPAMIWLVIGGVSLAGPILVLLLRGTIEGELEKNPAPGRSSVGVSSS